MSAGFDAEERGGALWISLRRPPVNVLDLETLAALQEAVAALPARPDLKAVVMRSAVPGIFSAGVDVADHTRDRAPAMIQAVHGFLRALDALPQATVAAVEGRALGGGAEVALCCDVVLASRGAVFAFPEIDVGCFPPAAAVLLPPRCGAAAGELLLTGRSVGAAEALQVGLVSRLVDDVPAACDEVVGRLAGKSSAVLALARRALRGGGHGSFREALDRSEQIYLRELLRTRDVEEGVSAFLEKRPPRWEDA